MAKPIKPVITGVSPTAAPADTQITITGSGFGDGNNIWGVFFCPDGAKDKDGACIMIAADWRITDDTTILALVPTDEELIDKCQIVIRTEGGIDNFSKGYVESNDFPFNLTT